MPLLSRLPVGLALNQMRLQQKRKLRRAGDKWVKGTITFKGKILISSDRRDVKGVFQMNNREDQIYREIEKFIAEDLGFNVIDHIVLWDTFTITHRDKKNKEYDMSSVRMRDGKPFRIVNLFNNVIELETTDGNCVPETMASVFPSLAKQKKKPLEKLKEANTLEIMEFCKNYGIRAIAYNIQGQVIAENIPTHDTRKLATLVYICYNNHMYLIDNKYLKERKDASVLYEETQEELNERFKELLIGRIVPKNIRMLGDDVSSFEDNGIVYFCNPEYKACLEIGRKLMFSDKISHTTTFSNVLKLFEPMFSSNTAMSFLPIRHRKPAFYYNVERDMNRETETIDKNKAYTYILKELEYLLSCDYRTDVCEKSDKFTDEYALYVCVPDVSNILMPRRDIYCGSHVKYCMGKCGFKIVERLDCRANKNHFKVIIEWLLTNCDIGVVKQIICRGIGGFQSEPKADGYTNYVVNDDEMNPDNTCIEIVDGIYVEQVPNTSVRGLYNRKPIAIQIKDKMNRILYEKMEELGLVDDDIVQINTDSITFYKKSCDLKLSNDIDGWKRGEYNTLMKKSLYDCSGEEISLFQFGDNRKCVLYTGYAGNGKSYHIQHNFAKTDLIVSCKHSAIRQHREAGFRAEVIQKYCNISYEKIPTEKVIIVEEVGLLNKAHWDFLFKCFMLGKKIVCYGDFQQLLPVNEARPFNSPAFLSYMFGELNEMNTNYRNNFSVEYYNSLINGDEEYCRKEILKWSCPDWRDASVIIAHRNVVVDKYNNLMLSWLEKKDMWDSGVPVICKTNDLRDKDIFNNFLLMSDDVMVEDRKHFKCAYARTLYNIQGDCCASFYVAPEDLEWFCNGRNAYTLISRLKTDT